MKQETEAGCIFGRETRSKLSFITGVGTGAGILLVCIISAMWIVQRQGASSAEQRAIGFEATTTAAAAVGSKDTDKIDARVSSLEARAEINATNIARLMERISLMQGTLDEIKSILLKKEFNEKK